MDSGVRFSLASEGPPGVSTSFRSGRIILRFDRRSCGLDKIAVPCAVRENLGGFKATVCPWEPDLVELAQAPDAGKCLFG